MTNATNGLFIVVIWTFIAQSNGNENAKRLFDELLSNYNKLRRPVSKPKDVLTIKLRLRLSQIIDVHEKDQIMTTSVWLKQQWFDPHLVWKPEYYGNVTILYVPAEMIWIPDIVLYNNADSTYNITILTKATLHYDGVVVWEPPAVYKSMCVMEVEWFPFDLQRCFLKFGSWSYHEELLDLQHLDGNVIYKRELDAKSGEYHDVTTVEEGIDLSDYYPSVEWEIMKIPAERHGKTYPSCCPKSSAFIDITYHMHLRRKPLFYTVNLIFPCVGISFLTIVVFYLPSDSGEKISLCISILVSLTVFFLLLTEIIPATSTVLPLIGKYLLFTMVMVTLSVVVTVMVLNVHFRNPTTHRMPLWVKRVFIEFLPKYLYMRRPYSRSNVPSKLRYAESPTLTIKNYDYCNTNSPETVSSFASPPTARTNVQAMASCSTAPLLSAVYHSPPIQRSTCTLDTPEEHDQDASMWSKEHTRRIQKIYEHPSSLKAFENVCFIASLLKRKDQEGQMDEDWKFVAMVLDRLFLLIFAAACFLGTAGILLQAPRFYDNSVPIEGRHQFS